MKIACAAFALLLAAFPALAQNVKITPIGSHRGELCANDRAIIFEDPTGVRFLYDAAQNVTGGNDSRLGTIHRRPQAEGAGRRHLREFGEGAGPELNHRRSRRGEECRLGDDPRDGRLRSQ